MEISNNKILITGGASSIGLGLTERFVRENNTVIICGRRKSLLTKVSDQFPAVITRAGDLSLAEEREALYRWIADEHRDVTVFVNNAGIQQWMAISDEDFFGRAKDELAINIEVIELIPPALDTDLGGKGLHDQAPPVSAFTDAVFEQLKSGKTELTFGFSDAMVNATPDDLRNTFNRMNMTT